MSPQADQIWTNSKASGLNYGASNVPRSSQTCSDVRYEATESGVQAICACGDWDMLCASQKSAQAMWISHELASARAEALEAQEEAVIERARVILYDRHAAKARL